MRRLNMGLMAAVLGGAMSSAAVGLTRKQIMAQSMMLERRRKGHDWANKRHKLKKSHQDHQRPRRRRV